MGVPTVGCDCAVCTSTDPHDRRLRPSILLEWRDALAAERAVVIDTGPDFREQALRAGLHRLDAVFYTHGHADHIFGLDDLRPLSFVAARQGGQIPLYAAPDTAEVLRRVYDYTFSPGATYPTRARVRIEPLGDLVNVHGVTFISVPVQHGPSTILGFRVGKIAYLTDVSGIPEESFRLLEGLDHLILSALRHQPHPSHATVDQAVQWATRIAARNTWFTHIAHDLGHQETNRGLPQGMALAYDGMTLVVSL